MRRILLLLLLLSLPVLATPWVRPRDTTATTEDLNKPLPPLYVPVGARNIALNKRVTSSDDFPIIGDLSMVTDGKKSYTKPGTNQEEIEGSWVELGPGTQWVQIDLGKRSRIFGIHIWHFNYLPRVYRDVIVQLCDENTFTKNVRTIYNNDQDDSSGLGKGTDREFYSENKGYLINTCGKNYEGMAARFVRLYSRGNTDDPQNQYIEVEVIGKGLNEPETKARREADLVKAGELRPWTFRRLPYPAATINKNAVSSANRIKLPSQFLVPEQTKGWYPHNFSSSDAALWENNKGHALFDDRGNEQLITLAPGLQWLQIDLNFPQHIYAIQLWHFFADARVYHDVIIKVADDATFTKNVRTLFNNDSDNSTQRGRGQDKEYVESDAGLVIDTRGKDYQGVRARYIRFYSQGNSEDNTNHYAGIDIAYAQAPPYPSNWPNLLLWKPVFPPQPYLNR